MQSTLLAATGPSSPTPLLAFAYRTELLLYNLKYEIKSSNKRITWLYLSFILNFTDSFLESNHLEAVRIETPASDFDLGQSV